MSVNTLLEAIRPLSDQYGTGDPRGDLSTFLAAMLLIVFSLLVLFLLRSRRRNRGGSHMPKPTGEGFDRYVSLAGKFEKLEMNSNASRTELMREVELLKVRVENLEDARRGASTTHRATDGYVDQELAREFASQSPTVTLQSLEAGMAPDAPDAPDAEEFQEESQDDDEKQDFEKSGVVPGRPTVLLHEEELHGIQEEAEPSIPKDLTKSLSKTRSGIFRRIREVFSGKPSLSEEMVDDVQAFLVSTDLGLKMVRVLTEDLKESLKRGDEITEVYLFSHLRDLVKKRLDVLEKEATLLLPERRVDGPWVVMMVGVNGVGKTTTTAKLAARWKEEGAKILLVAADTFRAAATEQLQRWGDELGIPVQTGDEGAKPGTVVYDAMERAREEDFDVVLIDTAGRLHTKGNLMQELEGMKNIVKRHQLDAPHEVFLVIDGTTGQNALQQAKEFHSSVHVTGLIVTKLDGTSKGGIVVAVQDEYNLPVRFIGVGEAAEDLKEFTVQDYVSALFDGQEVEELNEPSAHGKRRRRRREESQPVAGGS